MEQINSIQSQTIQEKLFDDIQTKPEISWFQKTLTTLGITNNAAWTDEFGLAISSWLKKNDHKPIKTLSLFSGGGGLDIAFSDIGFEILECVEIDKHFAATLTHNTLENRRFKGTKVNCIDIRDYHPDKDLNVDFIIGGPPCQTFSAAGRRAAGVQGTDDQRGTLFEEYVRLLKKLKPKGFLFENVYGIVGAQNGKPWQQIQEAFKNAGYKISWRILDAADYGAPQHRERLFIVGIKNGTYDFPFPTHGPDSIGDEKFYTAGQAVYGANIDNAISGLGGQHGHLLDDIPPGLNYSFYTEKMGHPHPIFAWRSKFSDYLYKADPDIPVRTIKAQGGQYTGPFSWENRCFTVSELKRLQTFPDDYDIVGSRLKSIMQLGNSVPPQIGRILALSILDQIMDVPLPFEMQYMPSHTELGFRKRKRELTKRYREKASTAIEKMKKSNNWTNSDSKKLLNSKYIRYLSKNFTWSENSTNQEAVKIHFANSHLAKVWRLKASHSEKIKKNQKPCFTIVIKPSQAHQETLRCSKIELVAYDDDLLLLTALWKGFEEKIKELFYKDDLVQFFGYYQYKREDEIHLVFHKQSTFCKSALCGVIQNITEGSGVGEQLNLQSLSSLLQTEKDDTLKYLKELKKLGFEIRSNNTNPQIKQGEYLIPYPFPSLTWRSVQLHKTL